MPSSSSACGRAPLAGELGTVRRARAGAAPAGAAVRAAPGLAYFEEEHRGRGHAGPPPLGLVPRHHAVLGLLLIEELELHPRRLPGHQVRVDDLASLVVRRSGHGVGRTPGGAGTPRNRPGGPAFPSKSRNRLRRRARWTWSCTRARMMLDRATCCYCCLPSLSAEVHALGHLLAYCRPGDRGNRRGARGSPPRDWPG